MCVCAPLHVTAVFADVSQRNVQDDDPDDERLCVVYDSVSVSLIIYDGSTHWERIA